MHKLTQESEQLPKGVNNDTKYKLKSNKGVITNKLEVLKQSDNEIMDAWTDEEEITNIMVARTEFEVEVQETLSVIEKVLTDKFRLPNIDNPGTSSRRKSVKLPSIDIPKFSDKLTEWPSTLVAM